MHVMEKMERRFFSPFLKMAELGDIQQYWKKIFYYVATF